MRYSTAERAVITDAVDRCRSSERVYVQHLS